MNREMQVPLDFFNIDGRDEMLMACTLAGRVIYMSGCLKAYLDEDYTGRNLNDFIADKLAASVVSNAQQENPYRFESQLKNHLFSFRSEGVGDNILIHLTPINQRKGAFIDKNSAQLISREINIALSLMLSSMHSLKEELSDSGKAAAAIMRQNMFRLLRLSRNMLDCAMDASGALSVRFMEEDVAQLCRDMEDELTPVMERLGINFTVNVPDSPVICRVDREKLERLIYNLISNSIAALEHRREITVSLSEKENAVSITVADTGRGIDQEIMQQVFSKHSELNAGDPMGDGGAGFGLALVNSFARKHNGNLVVTSLQGSGTSACVTIPKNENAELMPLGSLAPDYIGGHNKVDVELSTVLPKMFYY